MYCNPIMYSHLIHNIKCQKINCLINYLLVWLHPSIFQLALYKHPNPNRVGVYRGLHNGCPTDDIHISTFHTLTHCSGSGHRSTVQ